MDFTFSEEQETVRDLAASIFAGITDPDALWAQLAESGLVDIALPEASGGGGLGVTELCLVLEQQGRHVAPVPLLWHAVARLTLARFGASLPDGLVSVALAQPGVGDPADPSVTFDGAAISGTALSVPPGDHVLLPARAGADVAVVLVSSWASAEPHETTNHSVVNHLTFAATPATLVATGPDAVRFLVERCLVGLCAIQAGVAASALDQAAAYTSSRLQFGKPLSSFQSTSARAADCYIDVEAMRATLWQAAWRIDQGLDASLAVEVAKWWASEAGQRVVHAVQHMHGGIGADVEYPVHRYFLWGKQIEDTLGGGSAHLARIGMALAAS